MTGTIDDNIIVLYHLCGDEQPKQYSPRATTRSLREAPILLNFKLLLRHQLNGCACACAACKFQHVEFSKINMMHTLQ